MREYRWDQQNRLVKELHGTHESAYEYDGASRRWRITEKENGTQTKQETFVWCGSRICQKRASNGTTVVRSYFGNGFQESGPTKYFYTRDHLGSVREVLGNDGATIASRLSYDPWGKVTESGTGALSDFTYTGHQFDRATGLNLAQYRGYDPSLGRWLSRDPVGIAGGGNLYGYVLNDPLNLFDPNGLEPWWVGLDESGVSVRRPASGVCGGSALTVVPFGGRRARLAEVNRARRGRAPGLGSDQRAHDLARIFFQMAGSMGGMSRAITMGPRARRGSTSAR